MIAGRWPFAASTASRDGSLSDHFDTLNRELEGTNRRLQDSLREQERLSGYLNNTLESLGSGVVAVDERARVTLLNRAAAGMLG